MLGASRSADTVSPTPGTKDLLVGETLWREMLGGRPDVIGSTMLLEGEAYTIAGVMPPGFALPGRRDERISVNAGLNPPPGVVRTS